MKITLPSVNYNYNRRNPRCNNSFGHHPDFDILLKTKPVLTSDYFRRGITIKIGDYPNFRDIVNLFNSIFSKNIKPIKMLIAGIANSEEPFSYLTTIKTIIKDKPIHDVLDLYIIDLQSKPDKDKLFKNSYLVDSTPPIFAKRGFVYSPHDIYPLYKYRVSDELFDYLNKTYNDSSKSKWETRLQEEITNYPENYFNIISTNNVLYYMEDYEAYDTYNQMCRKVNAGGYVITENDDYAFDNKNKHNFVRYRKGIYQKLNTI